MLCERIGLICQANEYWAHTTFLDHVYLRHVLELQHVALRQAHPQEPNRPRISMVFFENQ